MGSSSVPRVYSKEKQVKNVPEDKKKERSNLVIRAARSQENLDLKNKERGKKKPRC